MCVLRVGPFSRRLTHFVAAALPKVPIRALKLGDRTSLAHDIRGSPLGLRRTCSTSVAVPPVRCRGSVCGQGVFPPEGVFLSVLKSGPSSRRHTHFVAAALSKVPIHALKLGDRTIIARVPRDLLTGFKARAQYKHHSAAGTVQRVGVARAFSRQRTFFFQSRKVPHRHGGSRISWRRHSQKSLYAPSS